MLVRAYILTLNERRNKSYIGTWLIGVIGGLTLFCIDNKSLELPYLILVFGIILVVVLVSLLFAKLRRNSILNNDTDYNSYCKIKAKLYDASSKRYIILSFDLLEMYDLDTKGINHIE